MAWLTATARVVVYVFVAGVFVAAVAAHAATYLGADFRRHAPGVQWLHAAVLAAVIAVLTLNQYDGRAGDGPFARWGEWAFAWALVAFAGLVVYTQYVWVSWDGSTLDRVAERPDGTLYLAKFRSGRVVRELTADDARWYEARRLRCLSGGWLVCSAVAAGFLASRWLPRQSPPDAEPGAAADPGAGQASVGSSSRWPPGH